MSREDAEAEAVRRCGPAKDVATLSIRWFPLVITRSTRRFIFLGAFFYGGQALWRFVGGPPSGGRELRTTVFYAVFAVAFALQSGYYGWRRRRGELVEVVSMSELPRWQRQATPWMCVALLPAMVLFGVALFRFDTGAFIATTAVTSVVTMAATARIQRWAWRRHLSSPWA